MASASAFTNVEKEDYTIDTTFIDELLASDERLEDEANILFDRFDVDESGKLDPEEFKALIEGVFMMLDFPVPPEREIEEEMKKCDEDDDGLIDRNELINIIKKLLKDLRNITPAEVKLMVEQRMKDNEKACKALEEKEADDIKAQEEGDDEDAEGDDEGDDEDASDESSNDSDE